MVTKHGHTWRDEHGASCCTPTYRSWLSMIQRCTNPNAPKWEYYGGRGITVCERWRSFEMFLADMGERLDGLTLDRVDNDGNYEPGNCRWADWSTQTKNRRPSAASLANLVPGGPRRGGPRSRYRLRGKHGGSKPCAPGCQCGRHRTQAARR